MTSHITYSCTTGAKAMQSIWQRPLKKHWIHRLKILSPHSACSSPVLLHRHKADRIAYERSASDDERDGQLGLEIKEYRERNSKNGCGGNVHNTDHHQGDGRPGDQTDDSRRDAFEEQAYARLADQLLQRIMCEEREGKSWQEDTCCQRDRTGGSAPEVTDERRKDNQRCGQQTG